LEFKASKQAVADNSHLFRQLYWVPLPLTCTQLNGQRSRIDRFLLFDESFTNHLVFFYKSTQRCFPADQEY